jgi:hypothetical protein
MQAVDSSANRFDRSAFCGRLVSGEKRTEKSEKSVRQVARE